MKNKYSYQINAANDVLNMALSGNYIASVLAAAPSAGKSTISIHILNKFFKLFPNKRVGLFTHNQKILEEQMLENFEQPNVTPEFTWGPFGSGAQVEVGIAANGNKLSSMDLLLVDEAHQYYWEELMDKHVSKYNPEYTILMTGSPSYFVKYNQATKGKTFGMHFISAEDLMEKDVFSGLDIDIVKTNSGFLEGQIEDTFKKAKESGMDFEKIMWAAKTINQAEKIAVILRRRGLRVFLSTSKNDKNSEQVKLFKKSRSGVLIVVNKGILGFSDGTITGLIDYKCSSDLEARYQLIARVLRKHPRDIKKVYLSIANSKSYKREYYRLSQTISLLDRDVFVKYNGTPKKDSLRAA